MNDPSNVRGVIVTVECDHCKGSGRVSGGGYQSQGEVINCPICNGRKATKEEITLSLLYDLLFGNCREAAK